jgi:hypothetical protein
MLGCIPGCILGQDRITDRYALVADVGAWIVAGGGKKLFDIVLALVAKRAFQ